MLEEYFDHFALSKRGLKGDKVRCVINHVTTSNRGRVNIVFHGYPFRGQGGPMSKSQILFFLTHLKTWIIPRLTLFTEWQKILPMPRYVAKLGTKRSFRGICMENYRKNGKKLIFFHLKNLITFHQITHLWPFLAKL